MVFLEDPVCDGCGAAFEYDGGDFAADRCAACLARPYRFARTRAACVYDEASRGLILKFKHGDQQQFAPLFARWLSRAAAPLIEEADAIVPVPLHPGRLLTRRFNQAAEIARPLARDARRDYLPDALIRARATETQGGRSARGRRLNVKIRLRRHRDRGSTRAGPPHPVDRRRADHRRHSRSLRQGSAGRRCARSGPGSGREGANCPRTP